VQHAVHRKAWYLLADPIDLPVIEVAFLNGQEAPTIETADADFNVLGIQMRGLYYFGRQSAGAARRNQSERGSVSRLAYTTSESPSGLFGRGAGHAFRSRVLHGLLEDGNRAPRIFSVVEGEVRDVAAPERRGG
jgi:hypothetical protein